MSESEVGVAALAIQDVMVALARTSEPNLCLWWEAEGQLRTGTAGKQTFGRAMRIHLQTTAAMKTGSYHFTSSRTVFWDLLSYPLIRSCCCLFMSGPRRTKLSK
jgi:hypothetical protein